MASNRTDTDLPRISVIIPTYNRLDELAQLLYCLEKQTLPQNQFETIIIDDGSDDGTQSYLKSLADRGEANFFFCCQKNMGPGTARNRGMIMARAPVFAFTDTDCRPYPDWLEQILIPFNKTNAGAAGGSEHLQTEDTMLAQAIHYCMTSTLTTGGLRGKKGRKLARYYPRTFNMAVSRKAFEKTGGFRALYHGEDVEFSFRIKKEGFNLFYNEEARVNHKRRCTLRQFFQQVFNMGEARIALANMHPELLEPLHVLPAAGLIVFAALLGLSFISSTCLYFLLATFFLGICMPFITGWQAVKKGGKPMLLIFIPIIFAVQQAGYGAGFLRGIYRKISGNYSGTK
jgi:GT2 family glycosyltransferase